MLKDHYYTLSSDLTYESNDDKDHNEINCKGMYGSGKNDMR